MWLGVWMWSQDQLITSITPAAHGLGFLFLLTRHRDNVWLLRYSICTESITARWNFSLLWLQISRAHPSCTNFSLAFTFRWQATLVAHLDSCKAVPSGSEGQLLKLISKYYLEEFQVSLKPSTEITNYHCCLCSLSTLFVLLLSNIIVVTLYSGLLSKY